MALVGTPICDFGRPAPDFTLRDPSGVSFSFADVAGPNGTVVVFICNHCPYVIAIADRLAQDAKTLAADGIGFAAIMSNDYTAYPADSPEKMMLFADTYGFDFPYLVDESQEVAKAYGAVCTPDFFGYDSAGGLQYRGRLDDAKMGDASSRRPELVDAMRAVAATGNGPAEQTPSMGCSIKWA